MLSIEDLGWDGFFEEQVTPADRAAGRIARVVADYRGLSQLDGDVDALAEPSGRLRHLAAAGGPLPVVGDWVIASHDGQAESKAVIRRVLARRSALSRAAAGPSGREQLMAANLDTIFIVTSFNQDLSANRIDRYLAMIWEAGAVPVVVVNKADMADDPAAGLAEVRGRAPFVDVHATSAVTGEGLPAIDAYLQPGRTIGLVGSSGVGKSSLVNRLLGRELLDVSGIRVSDGKGRHTTTTRQLVRLDGGALLVDTPGMRELQPWEPDEGLRAAFRDVEELAAACRFADCAHDGEPGCAVQAAIDEGALDGARLRSFRQLAAEAAFEASKHDKAAAAETKRRWKAITRAQRSLYRDRERR